MIESTNNLLLLVRSKLLKRGVWILPHNGRFITRWTKLILLGNKDELKVIRVEPTICKPWNVEVVNGSKSGPDWMPLY